MTDPARFDRAYYERYYLDPETRALGPEGFTRLAGFVCHALAYLDQPVGRVLDLGCGLGQWRDALGERFPEARYTGVEVSEYLCERFGWRRGSVVDYRARWPFDLVICSDVLQYLTASEAQAAIENLAKLCRGVLYFAVLTEEDWYENCDQSRTDPIGHLRPARWYRRRLAPHFETFGGGLFVSRRSPVVLYELEKGG